MAWLTKRNGSKNWYIGWLVGDKERYRSTGTTNPKKAEKLRAKHELRHETGIATESPKIRIRKLLDSSLAAYKADSCHNLPKLSKS